MDHTLTDSAPTLDEKADAIRGRFAEDPAQIGEILGLYNEFVSEGRTFPIDLEAHSLHLILRFKRPHDDKAAGRLANLLRQQGKPVPPAVTDLANRYLLATPEAAATARRVAAAEIRDRPDAPVDISKRLAIVFGLPKSASRLFVSTLAAIQGFDEVAARPYTSGYVGLDAASEMRFESFVTYEGRGVLHSHAGPSTVTRFTLARLAIGHVVTVRHPADHVAALFCHMRGQVKGMLPFAIRRYAASFPAGPESAGRELYATEAESHLFNHPVIFPTDTQFFLQTADVDAALSHMITDGYLWNALTWIADWCLLRIRSISEIVRYEDLIANPREVLPRAAGKALGYHPDDAALERGLSVMTRTEPGGEPDPAVYPRGYTGRQGIWRDYLSPENRAAYNRVCEQFVAAHPYGRLVAELYSDLIV